jgi:hypothetical protein
MELKARSRSPPQPAAKCFAFSAMTAIRLATLEIQLLEMMTTLG